MNYLKGRNFGRKKNWWEGNLANLAEFNLLNA